MPKRRFKTRLIEEETNNNDDVVSVNLPNKKQNTSNIGQLYVNSINSRGSKPSSYLYMGKTKFQINKNFNPITNFNDYFMYVINEICGYIESNNIQLIDIKQNPFNIIAHAFLSILNYNNIIFPQKVKIIKHDKNMIIGEPIYYKCTYEKNELNIHMCKNFILSILFHDHIHEINFSSYINHEQYSIKDNLQKPRSNFIVSDEMYKIFTSIIIIADHAATHYIEDYLFDNTDWIHHFYFGKELSNYTLISTVFSVSANVVNTNSLPKFEVVDNRSNSNSSYSSDIERIFMESSGGRGHPFISNIKTVIDSNF
ncbi:CmNV_060-like protein [Aratus pisonii nudivirus]|nr:CmNV_060-like protein [Aratus pisonii nudivirus]